MATQRQKKCGHTPTPREEFTVLNIKRMRDFGQFILNEGKTFIFIAEEKQNRTEN
jgi:hypothetical protein